MNVSDYNMYIVSYMKRLEGEKSMGNWDGMTVPETVEISSKSVFNLRREGNIDAAYAVACQLMKQPNVGEWDIKAYGYVLMSLIQRCVEQNDESNLSHYIEELGKLVVHGDDVFVKNQEKALQLGDRGYQQVESLVQAKRYKEAARAARDVYQANPSHEGIERLYCQALFNVVKEEAMKPAPKGQSVKAYLDAYFGVLGKSRAFYDAFIWSHINKLENDQGSLDVGTYYVSTMAMGLPVDAYRGERREALPNAAHKGPEYWPSLYGRMTKYVLDHLGSCQDKDLIKSICESVASHESRLREEEAVIINWKRGKVLMACGEYAEARQCVLQMIERKGKEYWAWSALGDTYLVEDESLALSAYCKALLCHPPLKFGAPLKLKVAKLLVKEQCLEEASIEVAEVLAGQNEVGKKSYEEAEQLSQSPWYVPNPSKEGNRDFYQTHKNAVLGAMYSDISWDTGMMLGTFTNNQKKFYKIAFAGHGEVPMEVTVTKQELDGISFEEGKFIQAKLEWYVDDKGREKARVFVMEETDSIEDFLPVESGIIGYVNQEKDVAHIETEDGNTLYLPQFSSYKLQPYTPVKVTYTEYSGPSRQRKMSIQSVEVLPEETVQDRKALVRGCITLENGYRAILKSSDYTRLDGGNKEEEDILIDHRLVDEHGLSSGVMVEGIALKVYNRSGSYARWRLMEITDLRYGTES